MDTRLSVLLLMFGAYILGSVPVGLIVSRLKGVDIRKQGSGNPGATNIGRVLGRKWGLLVFSIDVLKGAISTVGATVLYPILTAAAEPASPVSRDYALIGAGLCCVVGNLAPIFAGFKGGKGVATSLGVVLGIYPYLTFPALAAFVIWAMVVKISGYISLGSIVAAVSLPMTLAAFAGLSDWTLSEHYPIFGMTLAMVALVFVRHRSNIGRLLSGTENRVGKGRNGS